MKQLYLYNCPECGWQLISQGKFNAKCIHCHHKMIASYNVSVEAIEKFHKQVESMSATIKKWSELMCAAISKINAR